jgi:hypothetical protein
VAAWRQSPLLNRAATGVEGSGGRLRVVPRGGKGGSSDREEITGRRLVGSGPTAVELGGQCVHAWPSATQRGATANEWARPQCRVLNPRLGSKMGPPTFSLPLSFIH